MRELTFMVRARGESTTHFNPADSHLVLGFADRPDAKEICLATWKEPHAGGYKIKEIVLSYADLHLLARALSDVVAAGLVRLDDELNQTKAELEEYRKALHSADLSAYMEIFTRRAGEKP